MGFTQIFVFTNFSVLVFGIDLVDELRHCIYFMRENAKAMIRSNCIWIIPPESLLSQNENWENSGNMPKSAS